MDVSEWCDLFPKNKLPSKNNDNILEHLLTFKGIPMYFPFWFYYFNIKFSTQCKCTEGMSSWEAGKPQEAMASLWLVGRYIGRAVPCSQSWTECKIMFLFLFLFLFFYHLWENWLQPISISKPPISARDAWRSAHQDPENPSRLSQNCVWVSPAEVRVSNGLVQGQGLWVQ